MEKDGCVDEGVTRKVGEFWSDSGVCNLKECKSGGYVEHNVCPHLEIPDGCWLVQGDLSQSYPFCCPRTECVDESSSSSSSSSEDDDPDKYEDLEDEVDDGGDEFAFANLESFGEDTTIRKVGNDNTYGNRSTVNRFSDIVSDSEKYIKTLNVKRELRSNNQTKEKVEIKRLSKGKTVDNTWKNNDSSNKDKPQMVIDNDVKLTENQPLHGEDVQISDDFYEAKINDSLKDPFNESSKEENLEEDPFKNVKSGHDDLKEALDILHEDIKICEREGEAEIPPEALEGMDKVQSSYYYSEEFIKSLGPDEEFDKSLELIHKQAKELEENEDEVELKMQEAIEKVPEFHDPDNPNLFEGDEEFLDAYENVTNQAEELDKMQKHSVHIDGLDCENTEPNKWYEPLFESEYISNHEPPNDNILNQGSTAEYPYTSGHEIQEDRIEMNDILAENNKNIFNQSNPDNLDSCENGDIERPSGNYDLQPQSYDDPSEYDNDYTTTLANPQESQGNVSNPESLTHINDDQEYPDEHSDNLLQQDDDGLNNEVVDNADPLVEDPV